MRFSMGKLLRLINFKKMVKSTEEYKDHQKIKQESDDLKELINKLTKE
jgi:hypothetical protein